VVAHAEESIQKKEKAENFMLSVFCFYVCEQRSVKQSHGQKKGRQSSTYHSLGPAGFAKNTFSVFRRTKTQPQIKPRNSVAIGLNIIIVGLPKSLPNRDDNPFFMLFEF
jgi:hypothetical protein